MHEDKKQSWVPTNPDYDPDKPMQVGGQAVIEGVMMRAPGAVATAVRRANGKIIVQHQAYQSITEKKKYLNIPILRGAIGLIDMMYLGIRTLNFSAEIALRDAETDEQKTKNSGAERSPSSPFALAATLLAALTLGIAIFFVLPLFLTTAIFSIEQTALLFNLTAGSIRICILLAYMTGISFLKDVQQLFRYHGAEHKSVFAFELKAPLEPNSVATFSRFHPRCGTSFLLLVAFVSILSFSLLDILLIKVFGTLTLPIRLASHLPFIPVVGGIAYEIIKYSAKHSDTWWGKLIIAPGLLLQKITTKEPSSAQIEVALVALRCALGQIDPSLYSLQNTSERVPEHSHAG